MNEHDPASQEPLQSDSRLSRRAGQETTLEPLHPDMGTADVRSQLERIRSGLLELWGSSLIGIYAHGSLCLGDFDPGRSDLDLLVVTRDALTAHQCFELMNKFLDWHRQPSPLEVSVLLASDLQAWTHPAPHQFHFSEYWRPRFERLAAEQDVSFWRHEEVWTDSDLACHVALTRQSGIALYGPSPASLFPKVPDEHFWSSISGGASELAAIQTHPDGTSTVPVYDILTLARIWSYKELRAIVSKLQAAEWALNRLPDGTADILRLAAEAYRSGRNVLPIESREQAGHLEQLKQYVCERIR